VIDYAATVVRHDDALQLQWANGVEIIVALAGDAVQGIRHVRAHGMELRNPHKLWRPVVMTPDGIDYREFRLAEVAADADGAIRLHTDAVGVQRYLQEEHDEYLCDMLALPSDDAPVIDRFTWEFRPSALELGGHRWAGVAFRYRFSSAARKIARIFDDCTWEIGGQVQGNTLLLQGQINPPVTELRVEKYFTTACNYYGAEMRGILGKPARVSMQRLPRIATLQPFDFLAHARGLLLNYFDPVMEVFTVVQKDAGEDMLHVFDELRTPLSGQVATPAKHILFAPLPAPLALEEVKNVWHRALTFVHDRERARAGIEPSPVVPRVWIPQVAKDAVRVEGRSVRRPEMLDYMADRILPRWAEMGVKEICTHSLWVSDYTVDRKASKDDTGMHGALIVSGICCVRVHEIAPLWGGVEAVARFTRRAHELGMQVQLWWATHLSVRAPIFAERPDFMMIASDGLPNGGGYGHQTTITLNLANPDCLEWEFGKVKAVHEATGIDGFFHDSYGNMSFLPIAYNDPQRRGQQAALEQLVSRMQRLGLKTFAVEGVGPFGVGHFGMDLLPVPGKKHAGHYQCALDWWIGHEDMMFGLNMGIGQRLWQGGDRRTAREFAFRCMAGGGRFGFTQYQGIFEMWEGWLADLQRLHARIAPVGGRRRLLPGDRGVLWEQPGGQLLFTFAPLPQQVPAGATATRITPDGEVAATVADGVLQAQPWSVYRLA